MKAYKYGVELELTVPRDNYDNFLTSVRDLGWMVSGDGSVRSEDGYNSIECKTKPLTMSQLEYTVPKFEELCDQVNAQVNSSCGYHLHVSNKRFFIKKHLENIINTWLSLEDVLQATQPKSRLGNQYCHRKLEMAIKEGKKASFDPNKSRLIDQCANTDRYQTLNISSLSRHGTLECRLHSGTVNAKKIMAWARLITLVYNYALTRYNKVEINTLFNTITSEDKISAVFDLLGLSEKNKAHFNARISKFLIDRLASQQGSAIKAFALMPKMARLRKIYAKANDALSRATHDMNCYQGAF